MTPNCTPASTASTSITYYDSNSNVLGHSTENVEYGKFLTVPSPLPATVKIGDTAVYGTETIYTDSTKATLKGQRLLSYVIEADASSNQTAVANLITRDFNTANQLLFTQQSKFRLAADGALTAISQDIQYSTTSTARLVLTATPWSRLANQSVRVYSVKRGKRRGNKSTYLKVKLSVHAGCEPSFKRFHTM